MMYPKGMLAKDADTPTSYPFFDFLDSIKVTPDVYRTLRIFALECVSNALVAVKRYTNIELSLESQTILRIIQNEVDEQIPIDHKRVDELRERAAWVAMKKIGLHPGLSAMVASCANEDVVKAAQSAAYNARNILSSVTPNEDTAPFKFWLWQQQKQRLEQLLGMI